MSNHPISLISPFQMTQASIAHNVESISPSSRDLPSTGGAGTSAASVSTPAGTAATDVHLMQSNDATSFIYGSTTANKSGTTSDYTTVDDATKLANRVATDNDVIDEIKREAQRKKKHSRKNSQEDDTREKKNDLATMDTSSDEEKHYLKNTMMVASHGII